MISEITTERLILRKARESDLESIWKNVWCDPSIARNMMWKVTETRQEAIERLQKTIEYQQNQPAYFVCLKDSDEAIGFCGVREESLPQIDGKIYSESGICIASAFQNKGYGREVVEALKKLVFEQLDGEGFMYSCFADNEASRHLAVSCGFRFLVKSVTHRSWDDSDHDTDWFIMTREQYRQVP